MVILQKDLSGRIYLPKKKERKFYTHQKFLSRICNLVRNPVKLTKSK